MARFIGASVVLAILAAATLESQAEIPKLVGFQGRLSNGAGSPLADDTVGVRFTIYTADVGGSPIWSDSQNVPTDAQGVFVVQLGSGVPIPDSAFKSAVRWLGIKVEGDAEMIPRTRLVSSPYAFEFGNSGPDSIIAVNSDNAFGCRLVKNTYTDWIYPEALQVSINSSVLGATTAAHIVAQSTFTSPQRPTTGLIAEGRAVSDMGDFGINAYARNDGTGAATAGQFITEGTGNGLRTAIDGVCDSRDLDARGLHLDVDCGLGSTGDAYGVNLLSAAKGSGNSYGIYSYSYSSNNFAYGGYFKADSALGGTPKRRYGVYAEANNNSPSWNTVGVYADANGGATAYGVYGSASGGGSNIAVYGSAPSGATNYAGYFAGNAHVTGTLTKGAGAFKIDHPLDPDNKYLLHSFVESPDMKNVYDGVIVLGAQGEAEVKLPDWFEALNKDFRYQLTAIGAPSPNLYISGEVSGNSFKIAGGKPGTRVSWQVTGIRKDAYANAHRIVVEENKSISERGSYLHPIELGKPAALGLNQEMAETSGSRSDDRR